MSRQQRQLRLQSPTVTVRPNEGTVLDVVLRREIGADGTTIIGFGADLSGAPAPSRRYAADLCDVELSRSEFRLTFGQGKFGGGLRNALLIRMTAPAVAQFVEGVALMDAPSLKEIVSAVGIDAEPLTPVNEEPDDVVVCVANVAMLAISAYETCIDFYDISPFAAYSVTKSEKGSSTKQIAVEPIVRVDLRTSLFLSMLDRVKELRAQSANQIVGVAR